MTNQEKTHIKKYMDWIANGDSFITAIPPHTTPEKISKDLSDFMTVSKKHLSKKGNGIHIILTKFDERTKMPNR